MASSVAGRQEEYSVVVVVIVAVYKRGRRRTFQLDYSTDGARLGQNNHEGSGSSIFGSCRRELRRHVANSLNACYPQWYVRKSGCEQDGCCASLCGRRAVCIMATLLAV